MPATQSDKDIILLLNLSLSSLICYLSQQLSFSNEVDVHLLQAAVSKSLCLFSLKYLNTFKDVQMGFVNYLLQTILPTLQMIICLWSFSIPSVSYKLYSGVWNVLAIHIVSKYVMNSSILGNSEVSAFIPCHAR